LADQVETGDASPPSELGEDASVEIHRPKPVHNWRELATEVGVIVIGITIALGGDQALEWLHRRHQVTEARETLNEEIAENAGGALHTIAAERCLNLRLDQFAKWARSGPAAVAPKLVESAPIFYRLSSSAWEVEKSGAVAHMPLKERVAYGRYYDSVERDNGNIDQQVAIWLRLAGQIQAGGALTQVDARRLLEDVAQARAVGWRRAQEASLRLEATKALGVYPRPPSDQLRKQVTAYCEAVGATQTSDHDR